MGRPFGQDGKNRKRDAPQTTALSRGAENDALEEETDEIAVAETKIEGIDPGELEVEEDELREVPPGLPRAPFLGGVFGTRGAGKTTFMCKLVKAYDKGAAFDRVILFSPTIDKDPKLRSLQRGLNYRLEVYDRYDDATFAAILKDTEDKIKSWRVYKKALETWKELEGGKPIDRLDHEQMNALTAYDYRDPRMSGHFKNGVPSQLVIFDDFVGDKNVYTLDGTNQVGRFALRHRHYKTSVLFLVQAHNGGGGIPRQHRNNLSLTVLFANKSPRMKKELAEDLCGPVTPEEFIAMWEHATAGSHNCMMVDYAAEDDGLKFRKNFDTFLETSSVKQQSEYAGVQDAIDAAYAYSDSDESETDLMYDFDTDEENELFDWKRDERRAKKLYGQGGGHFTGKKMKRSVPVRKVFGGTARRLPEAELSKLQARDEDLPELEAPDEGLLAYVHPLLRPNRKLKQPRQKKRVGLGGNYG